MKAEVVQVKCQHAQEYGERYAGLAIVQENEQKVLLRVPMWQYDPEQTPALLAWIAEAINAGPR